ncbi:MAG: amidohydrolase family protein [Caulobacter sp.]|nr:amidohydrolase family protein [Caulobacter sp.]
MAQFDVVVKGGTIVDGTQMPRYIGDIGIKDGVIAKIGPNLSGQAAEVVDATGRIVAPGVIDIHTHYDAQLHWDPYATNSGWHGTTTIGVGNCGFGFAPCAVDLRDRYMQMMETTEQVPVGAMRMALGWDWETFPEWMEHLKRIPKGVNVASYVPLNPLLIYVMGLEAAKTRPATPVEQQRMKDELNKAMDAGAIGFGFSYQGNHNTHIDCDGSPMPTDVMAREDIYALASVLRDRGEGSIQALVDTPGARFGEVGLEVARISGRPLVHNVTMVNDYLPTYHEEMLDMLEKAEAEGLSVFSQTLTMRGWNEFKATDWDIWNISPIWREFTFAGDKAAKLAKAQDPDFRRRLSAEYKPEHLAPVGGPLETYVLNQAHGFTDWTRFEGKSVGEIAAALDYQFPTDAFMDILIGTQMEADFVLPEAMSADTGKVAQVLKHRRTIPGTSDGGAHVKFWAGGQYSTDLIMWMVRESGLMTLEELHYKLSYLPARVLGLHQRGALLEGQAADLYIYDYEKLGYEHGRYEIVNDLPDGDWRRVCKPQGIERVMVNGQTTFINGTECTGALPGRLVGGSGPETDRQLQTPLAIAAE